MNPSSPCVANKMINNKQCTIVWYVDDNNTWHMQSSVVDDVIKEIEDHFGKLMVTRGKEHVFVGMNIKFIDKGRVSIIMKDYITESMEVFESFCDMIVAAVNSSAKKNMCEKYDIDKATLLEEDTSEEFHHIVSKLLDVSKRAQFDIELGISYLCTRVSCSTIGDWENYSNY